MRCECSTERDFAGIILSDPRISMEGGLACSSGRNNCPYNTLIPQQFQQCSIPRCRNRMPHSHGFARDFCTSPRAPAKCLWCATAAALGTACGSRHSSLRRGWLLPHLLRLPEPQPPTHPPAKQSITVSYPAVRPVFSFLHSPHTNQLERKRKKGIPSIERPTAVSELSL